MLSTPANDSIALHYQPIARCSGKVLGLEALMRWHHRQRGSISPEAFIPIFERSGHIVPFSYWALKQACVDAASWMRPLTVSFNLSALLFQEQDLPDRVAAILAETDLEPWRLELEVTDVAMISDPERTLIMLQTFSAMGIGITLDDFGGKTSPSLLAQFPIHKIKIDREFVLNIEASAAAKSIVHMIIAFGHSLHLTVVAKGVETEAQLSYLRDEGCDQIQGFLIGHPAEIAAFAALTGSGENVTGRGATPGSAEWLTS